MAIFNGVFSCDVMAAMLAGYITSTDTPTERIRNAFSLFKGNLPSNKEIRENNSMHRYTRSDA